MKRSKHNLSHYRLASHDMGQLIPIGWYEVLPGDTVKHSTSLLMRVSPMVSPVMHPVQVRVHSFYVPYRLLWDGWDDFITSLDDDIGPPSVIASSDNKQPGSLLDYLGVPTLPSGKVIDVLSFPVNAYNLIFNEYYRDQDLMSESALDNLNLHNICWEKDYLTSARPWPQKGDSLSLPIGVSAPVVGTGNLVIDPTDLTITSTEGNKSLIVPAGLNSDQVRITPAHNDENNPLNLNVHYNGQNIPLSDLAAGLNVDLSGATGVTIDMLRRSFALQRYMEARAMYGSRYTEYLRYLGIKPADARLDRPEYLGGGKSTISFTEVLQTAPDADGGGVATMYGHGISAMRTRSFRKFFDEHGLVMTLLSVRPRVLYTNGLHRSFQRWSPLDYWQRELENVGWQDIKNYEVYAGHDAPNETFGYQYRYDDYRRLPSTVHGEFRSLMRHWHFARDFANAPALNADFVRCTPTKWPFAVQQQHVLLTMVSHRIGARRLVSHVKGVI